MLVVDCQTTGASPRHGAVLELGWCIARASDPERESNAEAHWIVPPAGMPVSAQVRKLTGFHEGVLGSALAPDAAWQRLRALMRPAEPMPSAIHFARFELSFLRDWSERFEPASAFSIDAVCVHAIACRLFPDLPRRNLRALAGFLGHGLHLERRSLGHVRATAFIWRKLVEQLAERGIDDWSGLAAWLAAKTPAPAPRKRRYPLAPASYRSLPDAPGVYRFLRSNGDVLYVGKAASLKKRVSSHFTKQRGATERALEMLTQVSEVGFVATSSALEAALLETQTIKQVNPPYNVQLVLGERGVWFSSNDFSSTSPEPDQDHRLGPLSSRYSVRALGALAQLLAGEPVTPSRRAASVGAPLRWAPDETSFAEGFVLFAARHLTERAAEQSPRRRARALARKLLWLSPEEAETDESEPSPDAWDGARVCRHLERAVSQAYRVLRRASWLCLLAQSSIAYREPSASRARFLLLAGAEIVDSGELEPSGLLAAPEACGWRRRQLSFDAPHYDSLRILSTELKRIERDGGEVVIRLSRTRLLRRAALQTIFRLV